MRFSDLSLDDQLVEAYFEASQPGWDGDGSIAVEAATLKLAGTFVRSLPREYLTPEISPEPDGHVNVEWHMSNRRLLSVSVGPDARLHWASLIGKDGKCGSCVFSGEAPEELLHILRRVC